MTTETKEVKCASDECYIIGMSINENMSIFSVGTLTGFKSFSTKTNRLLFSHEFGTPIGIVELFPGVEIVGVVSSNGVQNGTRLNIWDNIQKKVLNIMNFSTPVLGVKMTQQRIYVALENQIIIFNTSDFSALKPIYTFSNPYGICSVSTTRGHTSLFPSEFKGSLIIHKWNKDGTSTSKDPIKIHENDLSCVALSHNGEFFCVAVEDSDCAMIYEVDTGCLFKKLKYGYPIKGVSSIAFSKDNSLVAINAQDSGVCYIFGTFAGNMHSRSTKRMLKPSYFSTIHTPKKINVPLQKSTVFFSDDNRYVTVLSTDGTIAKHEIIFNDEVVTTKMIYCHKLIE